MNLELAAELTLESVFTKTCSALRSEHGETPEHARWMLEGIKEGYIQHEKGHRWLGYAQGLLVTRGVMTLDDAKSINQRA
jgi:hypothetical protein